MSAGELSRGSTRRALRSITATYREPAPYLRLGRRRRFRLPPCPHLHLPPPLALDELLVAQRFCDPEGLAIAEDLSRPLRMP